MPGVQKAIKAYTVKQKWRKAGLMVMAANRFKKVLSQKAEESKDH